MDHSSKYNTNLIKDIVSRFTDAPPPPSTFDVPSLRPWQSPATESATMTARKFPISRKSLAPEANRKVKRDKYRFPLITLLVINLYIFAEMSKARHYHWLMQLHQPVSLSIYVISSCWHITSDNLSETNQWRMKANKYSQENHGCTVVFSVINKLSIQRGNFLPNVQVNLFSFYVLSSCRLCHKIHAPWPGLLSFAIMALPCFRMVRGKQAATPTTLPPRMYRDTPHRDAPLRSNNVPTKFSLTRHLLVFQKYFSHYITLNYITLHYITF